MFKMGFFLKTNSTSKLEVLVSFWTNSAQKKINNSEASPNQFLLHVVGFLVLIKSSKLGRGKCEKTVTGCALKFKFYGKWTTFFPKDTGNCSEWSTSLRFSLGLRRQKLSA